MTKQELIEKAKQIVGSDHIAEVEIDEDVDVITIKTTLSNICVSTIRKLKYLTGDEDILISASLSGNIDIYATISIPLDPEK